MAVIIKGKPRVDTGLKENSVLRRYLDAAKFLDLIHTQTLFFVRGDQLQDKFEGSFTKSIKCAIEQSYRTNKIKFTYEEFRTRLRQKVFLNCWNASLDDNMAMWGIYGRSVTSLAITTTVGQLRDTLEAARPKHELAIEKVEYIRHWHDPKLDINPYSNIFAYKVNAYEFEKEVRVIIDRFHSGFKSEITETGMRVPISLDKLLRSIVIAPEAPPWFFELIRGVAAKYGVKAPVKRSKLSFDPV